MDCHKDKSNTEKLIKITFRLPSIPCIYMKGKKICTPKENDWTKEDTQYFVSKLTVIF